MWVSWTPSSSNVVALFTDVGFRNNSIVASLEGFGPVNHPVYAGGGLAVTGGGDNTTVTLDRCAIAGNSVLTYVTPPTNPRMVALGVVPLGGGVYVDNAPDGATPDVAVARVAVVNTSVVGNAVPQGTGCGVFVRNVATSGGDVVVRDVVVEGNTGDGAEAGGLYLQVCVTGRWR